MAPVIQRYDAGLVPAVGCNIRSFLLLAYTRALALPFHCLVSGNLLTFSLAYSLPLLFRSPCRSSFSLFLWFPPRVNNSIRRCHWDGNERRQTVEVPRTYRSLWKLLSPSVNRRIKEPTVVWLTKVNIASSLIAVCFIHTSCHLFIGEVEGLLFDVSFVTTAFSVTLLLLFLVLPDGMTVREILFSLFNFARQWREVWKC